MSQAMSDNEHCAITVFHVDPFTGILLEPTPPFERYNTVPNRNCVNFDTASDAIKYCRETVASHPHVQCVVNGLPVGTPCEFGDPAWVEGESKRRMEQNRLIADDLERRHRRDRLWLTGFIIAVLIGVVLFVLTRSGG
ncbi:hypothetical protein FF011L_09670 [Roseimaritima multifibrata]|uniref:Uncharacterized protein n=1 Tax=Roseimaritima multifibrata TaxID=1930274 RepID=A0A517MBG1_9BACT|nr:hypothetical protein FF011L_09670 [Roseimaritima multifibrata]